MHMERGKPHVRVFCLNGKINNQLVYADELLLFPTTLHWMQRLFHKSENWTSAFYLEFIDSYNKILLTEIDLYFTPRWHYVLITHSVNRGLMHGQVSGFHYSQQRKMITILLKLSCEIPLQDSNMLKLLIHWGLVTPYGGLDLDQHWIR